MADLQSFLAENRGKQKQMPPVDLRAAIAKTNEKQDNMGVVPYIHNASGGVLRGMMQMAETPYNIVNNAPKLVNLLPGEQGVEKISEMAKKAEPNMVNNAIKFAFPSEDPLIEGVDKYVPGMEGLSEPNPNYPITTNVTEGFGAGITGLGLTNLAAKYGTGILAKFAQYLNAPVQAAPKAAVAAELASSAGAETGRIVAEKNDAGPVATFFAQMLGSMGPGALAYSGPQAASKVFAREGGEETLEAMTRQGIRPSVGMTGNRMGAQLESGASALPFFSAVPENVRTKQFDQFSDALTGAADKVRPAGSGPMANKIDLSQQVYDIAEGGAKKMRGSFGGREDALMTKIGARTPIDVTNTRNAIAEMIPKVDPELQGALQHELSLLDEMLVKNKTTVMQPKASSVLGPDGKPMTVDAPVEQVTATNTVPYEQFRSWRTNVGRRTDQPSIKGGQSKQLYGAITKDLEGAADSAGVGDDFRKLMSEQAAAHDDEILLSQGGDLPQAEKLTTGQLERSGEFLRQAYKNPDKMNYIQRNATPEQWNNLRANIAQDLGLAKAGAQDASGEIVSPTKFITEWNSMDPRVKNMLFDDDLGTRQTLDDLALVADAFKQRGLEANTSRTAGTGMSAMGIKEVAAAGVGGAAGYANLPATATVAGMTYGTVKMLMSQTLARWAAGQTPTAAGTVGARLPGAVAHGAMDKEEPEERPPLRITVRPSDANKK